MSLKTKSKVKTIGVEEYINSRTGEVSQFKVINEEEQADFNFQKIWVKDLVKLLQALGGSKVKVFCHILDNKNSENIYIGSISQIAKKIKVSENTVKLALSLLKKLDYVRMKLHGVYQINPSLIVKGKSKRRQMLQLDYNNIKVDKVA